MFNGRLPEARAWWIDWCEGRRHLRKRSPAATRTEAKKPLGKVRTKVLPRDLGLFDPELRCSELVTRHLEALKGTRASETWRRAFHSLRTFFSWCPLGRVRKLTPELVQRHAAHRKEKKAGIEDMDLHTLRHAFASHLAMDGVDLASVKELLGHSTIQMMVRYAHLARTHLRSAVERFNVPSFGESPCVSAEPGFKRAGTA